MARTWREERTTPKNNRPQGSKKSRKGVSRNGQYQDCGSTVTALKRTSQGFVRDDLDDDAMAYLRADS